MSSGTTELDAPDPAIAADGRVADLRAEIDRLRLAVLELEAELEERDRQLEAATEWVDFVNREVEAARERADRLEAELEAREMGPLSRLRSRLGL